MKCSILALALLAIWGPTLSHGDTNSANNSFERGVEKANTGDTDGAIGEFSEAIRLDGKGQTAAMSYFYRGKLRQRKSEPDKATADFSQALALDAFPVEKRAVALADRGIELRKAHDYYGALADFDEAIRLDPEENTFARRGVLYSLRGAVLQRIAHEATLKAKGDLERSVELDPSASGTRHNLGMCFKNAGFTAKAFEQFDAAIELQPWFASYYERGRLQLERGKFELAVKDLSAAINLNDKHSDSFMSRGIAHERMENFDAAVDDYSQAIRINPKNGAAFSARASAHRSAGEFAKAKADELKAESLETYTQKADFYD